MADAKETVVPAGWEQIWGSGDIPARYRSTAPPNATVVEWADTVPPGGFVLDVGCGVGRHLLYLGEREFRLAGMDISPTGLRIARDTLAERRLSVDGRVSEMTRLPWADDTFDAALSTSAIHHHLRADIVRALAEVWRVLKPGGLFLADFPSRDTDSYRESRRRVAAGEIKEVEPHTFVDDRPDSDDRDGRLPHHFCDEADVRDLLAPFEIMKLWVDQRPGARQGSGGKWVAWARKPA